MAQLAAKEKLLYYRTPEPIVEAIVRYLTTPRFAHLRLLDPCAGTGTALALLAQRLQEQHAAAEAALLRRPSLSLQTYGIEPELMRVKEAAHRLDHVIQASFFSTTLSNGDGPDGGWQLIFLNPPYDIDTELAAKSGKKTRLEVNFLHRATDKLCASGILIWIVPQASLSLAARFLAGRYEHLTCLRFPDDLWQPDLAKREQVSLYAQFHQVVLFARKRPDAVPPHPTTIQMIQAWATAGSTLRSLPLDKRLMDVPTSHIPNARSSELRHFLSGFYDPDATASLVSHVSLKTQRYKTGVWANGDYLAARLPDPKAAGFGIGTPMAPLKNAHLAVLSVAGIANRAVLEGKDGRRVIVKGYSRKVPVYSKYEDEEEIVEKLTDTFETALWCIDLETGGLIQVNTGKATRSPFAVEYESLSLSAFLDNFGVSLTQQVAQANPPRYEGEASLPWVHDALKLLKRQPLGRQRETILAHVQGFLRPASLATEEEVLARMAPVAEMATGKTFLSLCSAFLADRYACGGISHALPGTKLQHIFPVVVLCPPIMARKWKREAEQTLPNVRAVIVKRMGTIGTPPSKKAAKGEKEEEDEGGMITQANDIGDFRQFDPDFTGTGLSAVGCLDRVVARIGQELDAWQREYDQVLAKNTAIEKGQATGEIQALPFKPCHVVIMTTSTAKLGKDWMPVYRLKVARTIDPTTNKVTVRRNAVGELYTIPCCPSCFRAIKDERRVAQLTKVSAPYRDVLTQMAVTQATRRLAVFEQEAKEPPELYLTEKDLVGTKEHRVKRYCSACGEALWQDVSSPSESWQPYSVLRLDKQAIKPLPLPALHNLPPCLTSTVRRRYPIGDYLLRHYKGFFHLLIADEMHEGADGTALDFARQRLASACGRMIGLTGTLSNGYSASLFRLYYVLNGAVRRDFGYHEVERWIDLYGKRQTTTKTYKEKEEGRGASSDRRIGKPITREVPGFAPQGLANVLPCSTFLELSDVVPSLPPYREEIRDIDLGKVLGPAYAAFEREVTQELGRMLARGDKSGLSAWYNGLMTYPNMPYRGWTCMIKKTKEIFGTAPALPESMLYPKERAIIRYVQEEYQAGRRVLIYTENTGYYDIMPRLKKMLERKVQGRNGQPITVAILRSTTVEPINREAWLDKQVEAGCDVLICNPKLVKVGLDLLAFPTIIYASIPKSTSDLRQSSRRSLRPGQTRPVKVVFFVYPTMEWRLLGLMARKMKASLMVEGKLPGEGLVSFGEEETEDDHDMYVQLAREVLASLEDETPTSSGTLEQAQMLQDLFHENSRIEREKNQPLGEEAQAEPVTFDPIRVELLSISSSFLDEEPEREASLQEEHEQQDEPYTTLPEVTSEAVLITPKAEPETVTIIHTAVTSGRDPWAALREMHLRPRKRRRPSAVAHEITRDLWTVAETAPSSDQAACTPGEQEKITLSQNALW